MGPTPAALAGPPPPRAPAPVPRCPITNCPVACARFHLCSQTARTTQRLVPCSALAALGQHKVMGWKTLAAFYITESSVGDMDTSGRKPEPLLSGQGDLGTGAALGLIFTLSFLNTEGWEGAVTGL